MSEFPDPDFTALRNTVRVRGLGSRLESIEADVRSGANSLAGEGEGLGLTRGIDALHQGADEVRRAANQVYASAAAADEAVALADHWESVAPKDAEIDEADARVVETRRAMSAAYERGTPAQQVATHAAAEAAQQNASVMRAQRISADEAYNTGMIALAAKVEQQTLGSRSFVDGPSISARTPNSFGSLKPPSRTTPGTPFAPRTPGTGAAPSSFAPRTQAADDAVNRLMSQAQQPQGQPVTLPGQAQPQPQAQQQPHPQAAAGGAPTAKAAAKKRDSDGSAPTGLAAAVGATGAGASPVASAATPRPTNPGFSVKDLVTSTNTSGRPAPQVTLSGGMPATAPATAAGTAAAPGGMGTPMVPPVGMGGKGTAAQKEASKIVQADLEPVEDGVVPGGTILRGDEPPEQKAS